MLTEDYKNVVQLELDRYAKGALWAEDGCKGIDCHERMWRRDSEDPTRVWYFKPSLEGKADEPVTGEWKPNAP